VFGITAPHVLAHICIRATPETREIACHLHGTLGGRQQFECDGHAAAADSGSGIESEDFLQSYGYGWGALVEIVNPDVGTAWDLQVYRSEMVELALFVPGKQSAQDFG
jgi:hypothetical protein